MIISRYISIKLHFFSFFYACLVVFIHLPRNGALIGSGNWFLCESVSNGISRVAVPFFFACSGFLLFKDWDCSTNWVVGKYKARFASLIIPFLLWNTICFFYILSLLIAANILHHRQVLCGTAFESFNSLYQTFVRVLGLDMTKYPYSGPMWYIRNLFFLVLVAPFIGSVIRISRTLAWGLLGITLLLWFVPVTHISFFKVGFSLQGLFFFSVGACLSFWPDLFKRVCDKRNVNFCWVAIILWCMLILFEKWMIWRMGEDNSYLYAIHNLGILVGITGLWFLYDAIHGYLPVKSFFKYAFFVYAFHSYCNGFFNWFLPSLGSVFIHNMLTALLSIVVAMCVGKFLDMNFHRSYALVTGGR